MAEPTVGTLIREARQSYGKRVEARNGRLKLSQAMLYDMCSDLEFRDRGSLEAFPRYNPRVCEAKIRDFERDNVAPTAAQRRLLERVLKLQAYSLDVAAAPSAWPVPVDHVQKRRGRKGHPLLPHVQGIRSISAKHQPRPYQAELSSRIADGLHQQSFAKTRIVIVHGQPGVGKSHRIAEWWWRQGSKTYRKAALVGDFSRSSGDALLRHVNKYFCGDEREVLGQDLAEAIRNAGHTLIVLDGLSIEVADTPASPLVADVESWRRVKELVAFLLQENLPVSLLLGVQTVRGEDPARSLRTPGANRADITSIKIDPLSDEEGTVMLRDLGVRGRTDADLKRISRQLMGLPIALEAAAHFLVDVAADDHTAFEEFVLLGGGHDGTPGTFKLFFKKLIDLLDVHDAQSEAHPKAFLRLLALFPGVVHKTRIEVLLQAKRIKRLTAANFDKVMHRPLPFVHDLGDKLDIHPFARALLLSELDEIIKGERSDATTDRTELQWIHLNAAAFCLDRLPQKAGDFPSNEIEVIEGAIYHLLALANLHPIDPCLLEDRPTQTVLRHVSKLEPQHITSYCYRAILEKYVLDRSHHMTRFLGHYETKARLLRFFVPDLKGTLPPHLAPDEAQKIYAEMGICWMHSGRLKLATDAISVARDFATLNMSDAAALASSLMAQGPENAALQSEWTRYSELSSTRALILMRQGRICDQVRAELSFAERVANELADLEIRAERRSAPVMDIVRSARRIITRIAHIDFAAGDIDSSLEGFQRASLIEARHSRPFLQGDAARRYVEALVYARHTNPALLEMAHAIVADNLQMRAKDQTRQKLSNDIIALSLSEVMLCRIAGRLDDARKKLDAISEHEFMRSGECPYAVVQEFRLEQFRLRALLEEGDSLTRDVREFTQQMLDTHHNQLMREAQLLLAEIQPQDNKKLLDEIGSHALFCGWRRWLTSVELLRSGRSPLREIGI